MSAFAVLRINGKLRASRVSTPKISSTKRCEWKVPNRTGSCSMTSCVVADWATLPWRACAALFGSATLEPVNRCPCHGNATYRTGQSGPRSRPVMALRHERPNVAPTCPWRRGACYRSTGSRLRRETCAGGARGFPGTAGGSTGGPERALAAGSGERSVTFDNLITALRGGGRASGACPVACARELERSDYGGFARFRRQGAHCGTGEAAASQIPKFPPKVERGSPDLGQFSGVAEKPPNEYQRWVKLQS